MKRFTIISSLTFIFLITAILPTKAQQSLIDRNTKPFKELVLAGVFNVEIKTGDEYKLTIDTDTEVMQYISVEEENNRLTIRTDESYKNAKSRHTNIYITCKDLDYLKIEGVGNINVVNALKSDDMEVIISGVGKTHLKLDVESLMAKISAVGDVSFDGTADKATMSISGVGNFDAGSLIVKDLFITNSGIGKVTVHATEELNLTSSGIGGVTYYGNPEKCKVNNSGIGKVKHHN